MAENNTLSLDQFVNRVKEGETINQNLKDGTIVVFVLKSPKQGIAFEIQKVMRNILSAGGEIDEAQGLKLKDPGALLQLEELGGRCLLACCESITPDTIMGVLDSLPENSRVVERAKALCGVGAFEFEEGVDDAGKPSGDSSPD